MKPNRRKLRRTTNACISCRQSKIKCSGEEPCSNCRKRVMRCKHTGGSNKATSSERSIHNRPRRTSEQQYSSGSKRFSNAMFGSDDEESDMYTTDSRPREPRSSETNTSPQCLYTSPFALPSTTIKNTHQNKRNWSTLSIRTCKKCRASTADEQPDISGLPSIDHALYLFNTVKFRLGENYQLIDEKTFTRNLEEFQYGITSRKVAESRLWFVQSFLVLSFGQAFLSRSKTSKEPPGSKFYIRAMALLPEPTSLWKDSLLAIKVLSLAGLYLYSIYHRESALLYDVDITTLLAPPSICSQRDATLGLHVKLSHLLSSIVTSIYKSEKTPLGEFLEATRSILHTLAGHAQEIERITRLKFQNSVDTMPKVTRGITLLYHQCVIMATRPLFLFALKQELESFDYGQRNEEDLAAPLITFILTGIKSATKTLQILSNEDSLLEVFLPFELEYAYGAAIHLTMTNAIYPSASDVDGSAQSQQAHIIFDEMIHKGNSVAEVRKAEFDYLESLFDVTSQKGALGI
ncbi:zn 2cys6 transcription factor [Colletotrichum incanum]|uniref:Zn 2cys6 transcription factor n=1 Tax=Colletotrichum incanum TaxID=1573173 RepID=A0A167BU23_COLIC|nr:zn 2cys6 transcription factor [Colletotrichum incanum]